MYRHPQDSNVAVVVGGLLVLALFLGILPTLEHHTTYINSTRIQTPLLNATANLTVNNTVNIYGNGTVAALLFTTGNFTGVCSIFQNGTLAGCSMGSSLNFNGFAALNEVCSNCTILNSSVQNLTTFNVTQLNVTNLNATNLITMLNAAGFMINNSVSNNETLVNVVKITGIANTNFTITVGSGGNVILQAAPGQQVYGYGSQSNAQWYSGDNLGNYGLVFNNNTNYRGYNSSNMVCGNCTLVNPTTIGGLGTSITSGWYIGNGAALRNVQHGLGKKALHVTIVGSNTEFTTLVNGTGLAVGFANGGTLTSCTVAALNTTDFQVASAGGCGNGNTNGYYWVAEG